MSYTFRRARSSDERRAAYQLRHRTFCQEKGWWTNLDEQNIERDSWDDVADLFVALDAEQNVVGTARTLSESAQGFQFDEMGLFPCGLNRFQFVEVSRVTVAREERGAQALLLMGLCRSVIEIKLCEGNTHWGGLIVTSLVHLLERTGIHFDVKTDPFLDYGAERMFVVSSAEATTAALCNPRVDRMLRGHHINPVVVGTQAPPRRHAIV